MTAPPQALFRPEESDEEGEPAAKRARFFDSDSEGEDPQPAPLVVEEKKEEPEYLIIEDSDEEEAPRAGPSRIQPEVKVHKKALEWDNHYFGGEQLK